LIADKNEEFGEDTKDIRKESSGSESKHPNLIQATTLHQKKLSSGSDEFKSNEATINEELTMDHGENSTTLSSINDS
jgi:hypothetical protein